MRFYRAHANIFSIVTVITALLMGAPLLFVFFRLFEAPTDAWIHIRSHLLSRTVRNTLMLIVLVGVFSAALGTFAAHTVARYEFKGRTQLQWLLITPLAMPSYILGYVYADMFSFTGTITRAFRSLGLTVHLNIMTLLGAAVIFVLVLYPYVYMIVRSALYKQSASYAESARTLGLSPRKVFFRITLPLLRPAMVAGTFLVLLETLNDYGLVSYFNVRVFSFAIFDAWFRLGDLSAAIRLSAILLVMVLALVVLERFLRGNRRYTMDVRGRPMLRTPLQGVQKSYPVILWSVLTVALFVPVLQLSYYAVLTYERVLNFRLIQVIVHSLTLSLGVTVVIVFIGLMMANVNRQGRSVQKNLLIRFTTLGYAIPGAVIAVAVLVSFVAVDRQLSPLYRLINPQSGRLVLTQSLLMLAFAMVLRFLAIGYSNIEATYDKIGERFTQAAYTLKHGKLKTLWRVDLPLLKGGLVAAFIIVFIDVLKELPLTLILRPTNYDTLASYVFVFAREEMIQETAIPSLTIIFLAIGAIVALTHVKENKGVRHVRSD